MPIDVNQLQPTQGYDTELFGAIIARGDDRPDDQVLTVATGGAAKGATTITLSTALTTTIRKGQPLLFMDNNDVMRIAKVNADADPADTTLTVLALAEAIAAGATAQFMCPILLATGAGIDRSTDIQSISTFTHKGARVKTPTSSDSTISVPMMYHHYNPGMHLFDYAYANKLPIWISRVLPAPGPAFSKGRVDEGVAFISAAPDEVTNDNPVTLNYSLEFSGVVVAVDPLPVA